MNAIDLFRLNGKHAIVTGGTGLIGETFVDALREAGALVTSLDLKTGCDLTDANKVEKWVAAAEEGCPVSILVNAAAINPQMGHNGRFIDYPLYLWQRSLDVNLTAMLLVTQAVCRRFEMRRAGVIVNIASTYGLVGPDQCIYPFAMKPPDYSTTKAGVIGFTRWLAAYYANSGIRVNCLAPGGVFNDHDLEFVQAYSSRTLLGRMARRDEYKGAILFLCSEASSYMTGANLVVDGGWTAI